MAVVITTLLLFTGLAVDSGRAYVVKAQLTKAVDGAALGAARNLNSGNPRGEAERIFRPTFRVGYMGTSSVTDPIADPDFFDLQTDHRDRRQRRHGHGDGDAADDVHAARQLQRGDGDEHRAKPAADGGPVAGPRRLELDRGEMGRRSEMRRGRSSTLSTPHNDRMSLMTFGNGATVLDQMPSSRGFNKTR